MKKILPLLVLAALLGLSSNSLADNAAWNVNAAGNWSANGRWTPAAAPGAISGTTNIDTATFSFTLTAQRVVSVDADRNLQNILFSSTSGNYALQSGSLSLTSGGGILKTSGTAADSIATAITIQGDAGTATFTNNASSALVIGAVSGNSSAGNTVVTLNGTGTSTSNAINGVIADGGAGGLAIVKDGTGAWNLGGTSNTFSGGVTLNAGTLTLAQSAAAGTGLLTINGGTLGAVNTPTLTTSGTVINASYTQSGTLNMGSGNVTLGTAAGTTRVISMGAGTLTFGGAIANGTTANAIQFSTATNSIIVLNGNSTFSGGVTVNAGALTLGHNNALGTGALTVNSGSGVFVALNATDGVSISNEVRLVQGSGLTGTGNLTLAAVTMDAAADKAINRTGTTDITGPVKLSDTLAARTLFLGGSNNGSGSISGVISNGTGTGAGNIVKQGTGTWTLSGANSYTGTTTIGSAGAAGSSGGVLVVSGAGKIGTGGLSIYAGTLDLSASSIDQTVNGIGMGNANAGLTSSILMGTGNLTLANNVSFATSASNNGAATISSAGGRINLMANRDFNVADSTAADVDLTVSAIVANGDATARNVRKLLAGVLEFGGANTYTGTTSVSAGTLLITGDSSAATGAITVSGLATLGGSGTIGGAVTVSDTGILAAGTPSDATATLTLNNKNLTISGSESKLNFDITGTALGQFDRIVGIAALSQGGDITFTLSGTYATASWGVLGFSTQSSNFDTITLAGSYIGNLFRSGETWTGNVGGQAWTFEETTGLLSVVPEPSTWGLLAFSLTTVLVLRRRRR